MHFSQMMTSERHTTQRTDCETFGPHPVLLLLSHWLFLVDTPPHIVLQADALDDSTLHTEFSARVYAGERFVIWLYFLLLVDFFLLFLFQRLVWPEPAARIGYVWNASLTVSVTMLLELWCVYLTCCYFELRPLLFTCIQRLLLLPCV